MKLIVLVLCMALVTYIPRLLPLVGLSRLQMPPRLASFLGYVPIAALGSLIFPAVVYSTGNIRSALAGATAAIILALMKANIMLVVLGAILTVLLWEALGGSGDIPGFAAQLLFFAPA